MSFAILEDRFAILRNIKDRFAICDLRSVNSDSVGYIQLSNVILSCVIRATKLTCRKTRLEVLIVCNMPGSGM